MQAQNEKIASTSASNPSKGNGTSEPKAAKGVDMAPVDGAESKPSKEPEYIAVGALESRVDHVLARGVDMRRVDSRIESALLTATLGTTKELAAKLAARLAK